MVPPVSLAALHVRLICELLAALAARLEGAVSTGAAVLAVATPEYGPVVPLPS